MLVYKTRYDELYVQSTRNLAIANKSRSASHNHFFLTFILCFIFLVYLHYLSTVMNVY